MQHKTRPANTPGPRQSAPLIYCLVSICCSLRWQYVLLLPPPDPGVKYRSVFWLLLFTERNRHVIQSWYYSLQAGQVDSWQLEWSDLSHLRPLANISHNKHIAFLLWTFVKKFWLLYFIFYAKFWVSKGNRIFFDLSINSEFKWYSFYYITFWKTGKHLILCKSNFNLLSIVHRTHFNILFCSYWSSFGLNQTK